MFKIERKNEMIEANIYKNKKKTNKRKLKKLIETLKNYQGNRCAICGEIVFHRNIEDDNDITIEHIEGRGKNNEKANDWENLVISCRKCNNFRSRFQNNNTSKVISFIKEEGKIFFENTYYDVFSGKIEVKEGCSVENQLIINMTIEHYGLNRDSMIEKRENFIDSLTDEKQLSRILQLVQNNNLDSMEIYIPYLIMQECIPVIDGNIKIENYKQIEDRYQRRYIYER